MAHLSSRLSIKWYRIKERPYFVHHHLFTQFNVTIKNAIELGEHKTPLEHNYSVWITYLQYNRSLHPLGCSFLLSYSYPCGLKLICYPLAESTDKITPSQQVEYVHALVVWV
jgi:hypothetical protein